MGFDPRPVLEELDIPVLWLYGGRDQSNPTANDISIIEEIVAGVPECRRPNTILLTDRREAIEVTIGEASPGDVVLIAGKGHEPYQVIGTERRPFDDRAVAAAALDRRRRITSP